MLALLPIVSLFALAAAQDATSASASDIAVVEAKFEGESVRSKSKNVMLTFSGAQLVPQFIPTFTPEGLLSMSFSGQSADVGAALEQSGKSSILTIRKYAKSLSCRLLP
jgi:hypothetical protein